MHVKQKEMEVLYVQCYSLHKNKNIAMYYLQEVQQKTSTVIRTDTDVGRNQLQLYK